MVVAKFLSLDKRVSSIAKDIKAIKEGKDDDVVGTDSDSSSDGDDGDQFGLFPLSVSQHHPFS